MSQSYDVAIVGLGAMGSASLYQLAKAGVKVVGVDRFAPPHIEGSTHGETRITRRATGEGMAYAPLAIRSHEIWREVEAETGARLLHEVGALTLAPPDDLTIRPGRTGFLQNAINIAEHFAIDHEVIDAAEVRRRFPNFMAEDDEIGFFEPGAGYLVPEACVAANLDLARKHGAALELGTKVTAIAKSGSGMTIATDKGDIFADKVIVSAGAWAGGLLGAPFDTLLKPTRQVMHWFALEPVAAEHWRPSPVFICIHDEDAFYGFPSVDGLTIKTAGENYGPGSDPDHIERTVVAEESAAMHRRHVQGRLRGVSPEIRRTATCIYTSTPDNHFLIDWHPDMENLLVVSPCSGHGFKHSAAIGEAAAELVTRGTSQRDLSFFALSERLKTQW